MNEALQLDPRNSHLHFLNGFVYHLQARQGDTQKGEMALEGYQQALRIDPGNWIAQEFLGLAHMDLKQFDLARAAFSEVLLLTPESSVSIYGLMVASYLTGDAKTACAMADEFRKVSAQPPQGFLRSSISVYASCGSFAQADWMRTALVQQGSSAPEVDRIDRRLTQWKTFYDKQEKNVAKALKTSLAPEPSNTRPMELAQAFNVPDLSNRAPGRSAPVAEPEPTPAAAATQVPMPAPAQTVSAAAFAQPANSGPRMLLVDVVLLSTQELITTSKGVNLLSALTLQLGSVAGNVSAFSKVVTPTARARRCPRSARPSPAP